MNIRIILALTLLLPVAAFPAGKELEGERAAAQSVCPTPEEAQKKMSVPEGYEVRCFAHEPMVVNPVAMTWDARGRLWVVEGYEYPNGSEFKNNAFGMEAKDDQYHPVPVVCKAKDNPLNAQRADHPKIPRDRIVILEDTDNDGVADKRTVFLEGLDMGSAILMGDGGVYVGQQPHLLHFEDTDGDDHADEWRVVLTGFGREDTHELLNSFCWGPDGWLYMTHGVFTNSKVRRPGEPLEKGFKFDAGLGRCRPRSGDTPVAANEKRDKSVAPPWEFEVFADGTSNPWGCDYDAQGNFFCSACVIDHFFHLAPGGIYARQGGAPENPYAYELLPSIVKHKHFRAAYAGVQIYQGGVYPADTHGHAFIGNIHDNAIHEEVLTPVGATFKCEPRRDFLRANDGWFRPVSTQTGPDGNLWIMDWCDKYPCYQNAKANPEGVDRERGRIWRVVYTGGDKSKAVPARESRKMDLSKLHTPELVNLLAHPNNWMKRMARRQLVERKDVERTIRCVSSLPDNSTLTTKLESLFTMYGIGAVDSALLDKVAANSDPAMRAWSARFTGEFWRKPLIDPASMGIVTPLRDFKVGAELFPKATTRLGNLGKDSDLVVRHASAVALRQMVAGNLTTNRPTLLSNDKDFGPAVVENVLGAIAADEYVVGTSPANFCPYYEKDVKQGTLVKREKADGLLAFACWQAAEPIVVRNWGKMQMNNDSIFYMSMSPWTHGRIPDTIAERSCRRIGESKDAMLIAELVKRIPVDDQAEERISKCLAGLLKGQEAGALKPTVDVSKPLAAWRESKNKDVAEKALQLAVLWGDATAIKNLVAVMTNPKAPDHEVKTAIQSLRKVRNDASRAGFVELLKQPGPVSAATLTEAIRASADIGGDDFIAPLTTLAASKDYGVRLAALESLSGRANWAHTMLDAIAENKISGTGFPASVRRQLATSADKSIRDHAFKVLGAWKESSDDTKALIAAKRKACLEGEPDLAQGKLTFTTTCAVCHTFLGAGQKVGPDLTGSGRSNLDALLANVIDPNQIIGNGYENINVTTKDGRTVAGRMVEDTPSHVKLLAIAGAEQIVPRDQIASLVNTHQSVMPVGFGALPDDVFRNLVWYVLSPPEEGPLTKEKKQLLSQGVEGGEKAKKLTPGGSSRVIDWESISLWNPDWKVEAPDFERTPMKLPEFHGRKNVLLMHPFTKDKPCALERKVKIGTDKLNKLDFYIASHDQGDFELRVKVDGQVVKKETIGHDGERWRHEQLDLSQWAGKEVVLRLEGAANGWSWEFGYWSDVKLE